MKAVIIGAGSIGKRHANNLKDIGVEVRLIDIDEINNIDNILSDRFDFGLVCTPNVLHIDHSIKLAERNIPIFCEKPFYSDRNGLHTLLSIVEQNKLNTMVGCNLRFTPEVNAIKVDTKYISVYLGYDLRKWRPGTNHLESYSANKHLGGGILLDAIHELDYLYHKFGEIKSVKYDISKLTDVTVDTEDLVVGRIEFSNGTIADFNLNYLSDTYTRYYDVLDNGVLHRVHFNISNQMYIDEINYFVNCIKTNTPCMNNFKEASILLDHIL